MLVIGHRGARGLKFENTIGSIRLGASLGVDALEFDVHLTKDQVPVLIHDRSLLRTHRKLTRVASNEYKTLRQLTGPKRDRKITKLEDVLDEFFGKVFLNIEIKTPQASVVVVSLLKSKYIKQESDWDKFFISSFKPKALKIVRKLTKSARLSLLHTTNPFLFIAYARRLRLAGIGLHNLHINNFALQIAKKTKLFTYVYTVNDPDRARFLEHQGFDAIVTDRPDLFVDFPRD